jgi:hypothetical protein
VIEVAAFGAWLGAAVIVLSDGRRGLALGLALTTVSFTVLAWIGGERLAAAALLIGGAGAFAQRLRTGRDSWGVMPPGSTARLVLSIAGGLLALWIATSVMTGPGEQLRFAAISVLGLMGARVLTGTEPGAVLTALAVLALAVAMAAGMADAAPGPAPYIAAALVALGVSVIRVIEPMEPERGT